MAGLGVHFALSLDQERRLLAASRDEDAVKEISDEIEEAWDEPHLVDTDKAWDRIHRCLSDGTLDPDGGSYPLSYAVLGGQQLHSAGGYVICYLDCDEVRDIAEALGQLDEASLRERFFALEPDDDDDGPYDEDDFQYVWENFQDLQRFYKHAGKEYRAVIFTGDL
jgi:hypothetical protein